MENSELHNIKTKKNCNLFRPSSQLTVHQKGLQYFGITLYNNLPSQTNNLSNNVKQFETALNNFVQLRSFYTAFEYFN
jgi:hypothetical protein